MSTMWGPQGQKVDPMRQRRAPLPYGMMGGAPTTPWQALPQQAQQAPSWYGGPTPGFGMGGGQQQAMPSLAQAPPAQAPPALGQAPPAYPPGYDPNAGPELFRPPGGPEPPKGPPRPPQVGGGQDQIAQILAAMGLGPAAGGSLPQTGQNVVSPPSDKYGPKALGLGKIRNPHVVSNARHRRRV